jgi:hypothetical protein
MTLNLYRLFPLKLYNYIQGNELIKLYYASPKYRNKYEPPNEYFQIESCEELALIAAPAVAYKKEIVLAIRGYETVPDAEYIHIIRLKTALTQ